MTSANSHVSPVIDIDRLNIVSIENNIDNGGLSDSDFSISTKCSGYANVMSSAYVANVVGGGTTNTATVNVHVEMTMNVVSGATGLGTPSNSLSTSNGTIDQADPLQFLVGDAVMSNCLGTGSSQYTAAEDSGIVGIVSAVTYLNGNSSENTSSITIKTNANNSTIAASGASSDGAFVNGCLVWNF